MALDNERQKLKEKESDENIFRDKVKKIIIIIKTIILQSDKNPREKNYIKEPHSDSTTSFIMQQEF